MKKESSPIFALSNEDKEKALSSIRTGIQQLMWQKDYVESQVDALPELPSDATAEMKQERAKRRVQVDAMDKKVDDQVAFYNFCKNNI